MLLGFHVESVGGHELAVYRHQATHVDERVAALAELGPCSQHRYSFINVRRLVAVEGELVPEDALDMEPEQQSQLG